MGSGKEPIPVFATRIKARYPQYKDIEDTLLVNKIIEKYPEYKEQVDIVVEPPKKKRRWWHFKWRI